MKLLLVPHHCFAARDGGELLKVPARGPAVTATAASLPSSISSCPCPGDKCTAAPPPPQTESPRPSSTWPARPSSCRVRARLFGLRRPRRGSPGQCRLRRGRGDCSRTRCRCSFCRCGPLDGSIPVVGAAETRRCLRLGRLRSGQLPRSMLPHENHVPWKVSFSCRHSGRVTGGSKKSTEHSQATTPSSPKTAISNL